MMQVVVVVMIAGAARDLHTVDTIFACTIFQRARIPNDGSLLGISIFASKSLRGFQAPIFYVTYR